jgi:hypothetical protein
MIVAPEHASPDARIDPDRTGLGFARYGSMAAALQMHRSPHVIRKIAYTSTGYPHSIRHLNML